MKIIAMIPARLGSQRLKQKNLQLIHGEALIAHAIRKAKLSNVFDEIWVNSEADIFGEIAKDQNGGFQKRPDKLADNHATSEDFVYEFLRKHECDYLVQVHSVAPLLTVRDTVSFVNALKDIKPDVLLSVEDIQIECAFQNIPINFNYDEKTNSQDLYPIERITWSITAWKRDTYIDAYQAGLCATYAGKIQYHPIDKLASHVIKTQNDLDIANALYHLVH